MLPNSVLFKCFVFFVLQLLSNTSKQYLWNHLSTCSVLYLPNNNNKLKMLKIIGKYRSRSSCQYQKLSHHYEKVTTRTIRHKWGKKLEGRSKGFRLNRPRRLVLKALVLPRRILSIYARITDKMNREGLYPNLILSSHWGFPIVLDKKLRFWQKKRSETEEWWNSKDNR